MALEFMYITNQEEIAKIAEKSGVDCIFIDLEINGKEERQGYLNSVISRHSIEDVKKIKKILDKAQLLVRVNPIYEDSKREIDQVIKDGADIVMLPFFKTLGEVETFITYIGGRAKACLLVETVEAVESIDDILNIKGIDFMHIGLNDLHLAYTLDFMFELLTNGVVERLCKKFKDKGIKYGFGGIAKIGQGVIPAELIIGEHYRLGSERVILSRSFCDVSKIDNVKEIDEIFVKGIKEIKEYENYLKTRNEIFFLENKELVKKQILKVL